MNKTRVCYRKNDNIKMLVYGFNRIVTKNNDNYHISFIYKINDIEQVSCEMDYTFTKSNRGKLNMKLKIYNIKSKTYKMLYHGKLVFKNISLSNMNKTQLEQYIKKNEPNIFGYTVIYNEYITNLLQFKNVFQFCFGI